MSVLQLGDNQRLCWDFGVSCDATLPSTPHPYPQTHYLQVYTVTKPMLSLVTVYIYVIHKTLPTSIHLQACVPHSTCRPTYTHTHTHTSQCSHETQNMCILSLYSQPLTLGCQNPLNTPGVPNAPAKAECLTLYRDYEGRERRFK